jgi:hypothetical protein
MTVALDFLPEFAVQLHCNGSGNQADQPIPQLTPNFVLQSLAV